MFYENSDEWRRNGKIVGGAKVVPFKQSEYLNIWDYEKMIKYV